MPSHGKNTVVKVDNAAGTAVDLSQYTDKSTWPQDLETAEVTTFGLNSKAYIGGLQDSKFSMEGPWDTVLDAHMAGIIGAATTKTVEFAPNGTTAGNRKYLAESILTNYEPSGAADDANRWKAEFQITGDVTRTTY